MQYRVFRAPPTIHSSLETVLRRVWCISGSTVRSGPADIGIRPSRSLLFLACPCHSRADPLNVSVGSFRTQCSCSIGQCQQQTEVSQLEARGGDTQRISRLRTGGGGRGFPSQRKRTCRELCDPGAKQKSRPGRITVLSLKGAWMVSINQNDVDMTYSNQRRCWRMKIRAAAVAADGAEAVEVVVAVVIVVVVVMVEEEEEEVVVN
ncbi:hypothetical protein BC939DRAFT_209658 [Gamsiella multidivaricata]|uniref:uncharacterized protein n=1 Tax=Gamsiella multidivaricata TaxID=101098 RepID=UPI00221F3CAC|nr:uncharacterized protein BC939DRAFT_209658 [Gamsiella multidivaricata]KAI7821179.1 hypothetical protein BC939DRAFT_209658 [Gamsiella multidivaricata]